MIDSLQKQTGALASCEICLREIPASEAKSEEASDYVVYFFGLECYAIWKEKAKGGRRSLSNK